MAAVAKQPTLSLRNDSLMTMCTDRVLGLVSSEHILQELAGDGVTEPQLVKFLKRRDVQSRLRSLARKERESGDVAKRLANTGMVVGVKTMTDLLHDGDVGPGTKVAAVGALNKAASTLG